jgi:cytochrome c biogenesis protein CcdA
VAVPLSAVAAAFGIGLMTSVSPCPLATNVVAVSLVARRLGDPRPVLPALSLALQKHMNRILGPLLVVTGMVLLGLVPLPLPARTGASPPRGPGERFGVWGSGLLGILFAMSFCPVSAAALGARSFARAFHRVTTIERWARIATGAVFVLVGVYYCLVHIFRVLA